jgi:hypothetical protein
MGCEIEDNFAEVISRFYESKSHKNNIIMNTRKWHYCLKSGLKKPCIPAQSVR